MSPDLAALAVVAVVLGFISFALYRSGRHAQALADADKTSGDVAKAKAVEADIDTLSDDGVRKRLRDSWTKS